MAFLIRSRVSNTYLFLTTVFSCANSYLQYAQICARAVRNSLKEEARVVAVRRDEQGLKVAKWEAGKQGEVVSEHWGLSQRTCFRGHCF